MGLPFIDDFAAAAGLLADPPYTQAALATERLHYDGANHAKASAVSTADLLAYDNSNVYADDHYGKIVLAGGQASGTNYAEVTTRNSGSAGTFACYFQITDGANGAGHTDAGKWVGGSQTTLTNYSPISAFATGDEMKLESTDTTHSTYQNDALVGSFVDAAITSGAPGCGVYNSVGNNVLLESFQGDNYGAAPVITRSRKLATQQRMVA